MRALIIALLAAAAAPAGAAPSVPIAPFAGSVAVPDAELARNRGGFSLPGGIDVAIGIAIETRVDGQVALRTVLGANGVNVSGDIGAQVTKSANQTIARLAANGVDIQQLIGAQTGTIIANTANNRVIDTTTTIDIQVAGRILPPNFTSSLESATRNVLGR